MLAQAWGVPDAVAAAVFAVCLVTVAVLVTPRAVRSRPGIGGLPVAAGLVVALVTALLVHGLPTARLAVGGALVAVAVLAVLFALRRRRRSAIDPPDRRC